MELDCAGNVVSGMDGLSMRWKLVALLLCSLALWEIIVRFFVVSPAVVFFDHELGAMKAPYSSILRTYEGYSRFKTDQYGFNNDVLPKTLPDRRILVLGDSFVEAEQVMRQDNFVTYLNKLPNTFAYNAGYSGADPRAFPILLKRFFQRLKPTQIILCVNAADLDALETERLPFQGAPVGLKRWLQPVFAHSALATHLNWKYKPVMMEWWLKVRGINDGVYQQNGLQQKTHQDEHIKHWRHILLAIQQYKIPTLLLMMPNIHYGSHAAMLVPSKNHRDMVKTANDMGIKVLQSSEIFIRNFQETGLVALGFPNSHLGYGHLNRVGHRIVGREIERALR